MIILIRALLKSAIPFALISSYSTPFELKHALTKSRTTHLFTEPSRLSILQATCKDGPVTLGSSNVFFVEGEGGGRTNVDSLVQAGLSRARKAGRSTGGDIGTFKSRPAQKDTLAYLVFSSGTSGLPKGLLWFLPHHASLVSETILV
jgi:long-subunit acyl-CoA synthetase (AMP-forming)